MRSFNQLYNIVISAVCMGLAQHPLGLGWLAWFCLVPLFVSIKDDDKAVKTLIKVFIWGFIYHLVSLYWLTDNIGLPNRYIAFTTMIASNIICTLNIIFIFSIWRFVNFLNNRKIWYSLPFIWMAIDFIRSLDQLSFPWSSIANTQAQESLLPMIQFIELTGMFGITFWIVSLNISLFYIFLNRSKIKILESVAIFFLPLIIGFIINKNDINNIEKIDFAILQPNIHIDDKWKGKRMLDKHLDKSDKDLKDILLIWPESAFTDDINYKTQQAINSMKINKMFRDSNISLISGVTEKTDGGELYNSIYYLNQNNKYDLSRAEKYRKIKLVPMAEHVPFKKIFPSLGDIALSGNFSKGDEYKIFKYRNSSFAAMVCIESTYPDLSRKFVNKGAQFLIYVANDGWYINPPQAQQHAKQTIFRAIETRKSIIRSGNTGITWVVTPSGEVISALEHNSEGILRSEDIELYSNNTKTLYVLAGDWLSYISIVVTFCLILVGFIRRYKR